MSHTSTFKLSKDQKRELIMLQIKEVFERFKFNKDRQYADPLYGLVWGQYFLNFDMSFCMKCGLHYVLYLDSLENLGTEKHLPLIDRAQRLKDIGCFGLTELGHGSNVAQFGTTAHYIREAKEFVINTPNSQATKWWIGGASRTATKCVILAQLYVDGIHHGIHAFVVDLRDEHTFKIKEGIVIGDCGKKFGHDGIDNGFIIFNNYRIPYDRMLDKISHITPEGKFVSSIKKKEKRLGIMLSTLIRGRTAVLSSSEGNLKNALTIAIRWSAIRKQFGPPNSPEVPILDYPLTRARLIPHLANLFGIAAAAEIVFLSYDGLRKKTAVNPDCFESTEFHAVLSAMKVICSEWSFQGIHECRRVCGGLGYSSLNKIGELLTAQDVNLTWEGDNHILIQQAAGFVVKQSMKNMQGNKMQGFSLKSIKVSLDENNEMKWGGNPENMKDIGRALEDLFSIFIGKALRNLQKNSGKYENYFDVWNNTQPVMQNLGKLYGMVQISNRLQEHIESLRAKSSSIFEIVQDLFKVYAIDKILRYKSDLIASTYLTSAELFSLEKYFEVLCLRLGESCVNVIDAIANYDSIIDSSIGLSDGQAYSRFTSTLEAQPDCYGMPVWLEDIRNLTK